ncbi:glycoside hydrolase, partial [Gloeophyllum trabeum ATCC 11539]
IIQGTADFYAIDAYRAQYVAAPAGGLAACVNNMTDPNWPQCNEVVMYDTDGWAVGPNADTWSASWLQATPQNLRGSLRALVGRWPVGKIYISEFGFNEPGEARRSNSLLTPWDGYIVTEDVTRTNYYMTYLGEALLAIHEDGIPLMGAFAWSFIDDAEWTVGFAARFGIQYLNQTTLERTPKRSAFALCERFCWTYWVWMLTGL